MTSMVRFRAGDGEYAVSVDDTREVRSADGIVPMPTARTGRGRAPRPRRRGRSPSPTCSARGKHVLVLDPGNGPFGLLVEEVLGVFIVDLNTIGPAPTGQPEDLVSGSFLGPDGLLLVARRQGSSRSALSDDAPHRRGRGLARDAGRLRAAWRSRTTW